MVRLGKCGNLGRKTNFLSLFPSCDTPSVALPVPKRVASVSAFYGKVSNKISRLFFPLGSDFIFSGKYTFHLLQ